MHFEACHRSVCPIGSTIAIVRQIPQSEQHHSGHIDQDDG